MKWKEVVGMTADWLAILAALGITTLGEWLHRGNDRTRRPG